MKQIFYNKWTLARTFLISFQCRFYLMYYNTISRHCYEILNMNCAKRTDTIGIHYKYLERPRC